MKGIALAAVALAGILACLIVAFGVFSLLGVVASYIWFYAVVAVWPSLPAIVWWQFALMALGLNIIRALLFGNVK